MKATERHLRLQKAISGGPIESRMAGEQRAAVQCGNGPSFLVDQRWVGVRTAAVRVDRAYGFRIASVADCGGDNATDDPGIRHVADVGRWTQTV